MEALEDTGNGGHVVVFLLHAGGVVLAGLIGTLHGIGGNEEFVGVGKEAEAVVVIEGDGEVQSQTQVGGDELAVVGAAVADLGTDIGDIQSYADAALALSDIDVVIVVHGDIGGKGFAGRALVLVVEGDVGEDETHSNRHREVIGEHT